MSFDYLMGYIMSISMCMQNFITIFHSVQEIGPFSLFQNLKLGKVSTDEKCHFAISWARSYYSKIFQNGSRVIYIFRHFSRTGRGQNLHKLSGDKIKCLIIGHSMKLNFKFQLTFLGSCNNAVVCLNNAKTSSTVHIEIYLYKICFKTIIRKLANTILLSSKTICR